MTRKSLLSRLVGLALVAGLPAVVPSSGAAARGEGSRADGLAPLVYRGPIEPFTNDTDRVIERGAPLHRSIQRDIPAIPSGAPDGLVPPEPPDTPITSVNPEFEGWTGLIHADSRLSDEGNQFSNEPPDPVVCTNGQLQFQAVNQVAALYDSHSTLLAGPQTLNDFYGYPPAIDRSKGTFPGPFIFDPKCFRDAETGHWYFTNDRLEQDPVTGDFTGESGVDIAVSATKNPLGTWHLYTIDTTDEGGPGCPCFADQPLIGGDANGFYISVNEFPVFEDGFNGAEIYAMSKAELEDGVATEAAFFEPESLEEGIPYSIQPAVAGQGDYDETNGGTQYFLSALNFDDTLDNRIAVWAATNTGELDGDKLAVELQHVVIDSQTYGQPPKATQKERGPHPLGQSVGEPIHFLDTGDSRFQQAERAAGHLWGNNSTVIGGEAEPRAGIAWYQVSAQVDGGVLSASIATQGYVTARNTNLTYAAIGANSTGDALLAFTITGPRRWPSAGYVELTDGGGNGPIHLAAAGARPEDGFTCYNAFVGDNSRGCRWGDYSEVNVTPDGRFWFSTEYIPPDGRTQLANWGTFVGKVNPS